MRLDVMIIKAWYCYQITFELSTKIEVQSNITHSVKQFMHSIIFLPQSIEKLLFVRFCLQPFTASSDTP